MLLLHRSWLYKDSGEGGGLKTSSTLQLRRRAYLSSLWILQVLRFDSGNDSELDLSYLVLSRV